MQKIKMLTMQPSWILKSMLKEINSRLKHNNERENFEIDNYPDLSGNIPHRAAYRVYTPQVIRYAWVCNGADDFKKRVNLLTNKLIRK